MKRIRKLFSKKEDKNGKCPNCKETVYPCACMRNICGLCGKPVGNITFSICDKCFTK